MMGKASKNTILIHLGNTWQGVLHYLQGLPSGKLT
jgi:hypothetical protein